MKILNILALATMALLNVGAASSAVAGDASTIQLPEPGTLALLAGGVATALLIRRRKK